MLLDGATGAILDQSLDYGFGGIAIAVADMIDDKGGTYDEIVLVTAYGPIDSAANPVHATVRVLDHDGTNLSDPSKTGFMEEASARVGNSQTTPMRPGFGACGVAVANVDLNTSDPEIIVTTLTGELVVYPWNRSTKTIGPPIYHAVLEGALGAWNSIIVRDIAPADGKPEIYIAGASGIRRFDVQ